MEDVPPSTNDLSKAHNSLRSSNGSGKDCIPPDVIKAGKELSCNGHPHILVLHRWEEGAALKDLCDMYVITL